MILSAIVAKVLAQIKNPGELFTISELKDSLSN